MLAANKAIYGLFLVIIYKGLRFVKMIYLDLKLPYVFTKKYHAGLTDKIWTLGIWQFFDPVSWFFCCFLTMKMYMRLMYNILKDPETFLIFRMPKRQFLKNWT